MFAQTASDVQGFLPSVRWWFRIRRFKTWVGTRVWTLWSPKERVGGKEPTRWENLYSSQIVLFVVPSSERVTVWCRYLKKYCFFVPFFKFKIDVFRCHFFLVCKLLYKCHCSLRLCHQIWLLKFWSPGPKIWKMQSACWKMVPARAGWMSHYVTLHITTSDFAVLVDIGPVLRPGFV